jgi:hypothetical protein
VNGKVLAKTVTAVPATKLERAFGDVLGEGAVAFVTQANIAFVHTLATHDNVLVQIDVIGAGLHRLNDDHRP